MNLRCWNCQGTIAKGFAGLIKDLRREYYCSLIALLETHTNGSTANKIIKKNGFEKNFIQRAQGQSGGFWLLWDSAYWNLTILNSSSQWVHAEVKVHGASSWFITIVYGCPHFARRKSLWDDLLELHSSTIGLWVVMADFNATL